MLAGSPAHDLHNFFRQIGIVDSCLSASQFLLNAQAAVDVSSEIGVVLNQDVSDDHYPHPISCFLL